MSTSHGPEPVRDFTRHRPFAHQVERFRKLGEAASRYADAIAEMCPASPERTRAIGLVHEAAFLANVAISIAEATLPDPELQPTGPRHGDTPTSPAPAPARDPAE